MTLKELLTLMSIEEQSPGLSILGHGYKVIFSYFMLSIAQQKDVVTLFNWKLPKWWSAPEIWSRVEDNKTMFNYLVFHDCGKPFCREVDSDNKVHYNEHAKVSAEIWREFSKSETECELIALDMWAHTCSDPEAFIRHRLAPSLIMAALAEIHANAEMFGGIESESFKIKWKRIDKLGKKLLERLQSV